MRTGLSRFFHSAVVGGAAFLALLWVHSATATSFADGVWMGDAFVIRGPGGTIGADGEQLPVRALAIDGDRAVIGVIDDLDVPSSRYGAVYVLARSAGAWRVEAKLHAPDRQPGDYFGSTVAIVGDLIAVAAASDDGDCELGRTGQVHLFQRDDSGWRHLQALSGSDSAACDRFGHGLALVAERMVVGAPGHGDGAEEDRGAAYVFERHADEWIETAKLVDPSGARYAEFGRAVAVHGSTIAVASPAQPADRPGAVQVFDLVGATWLPEERLSAVAARPGDLFGLSLAMSDEVLVAGGVGAAPQAFSRDNGAFLGDAPLVLPGDVLDGELPRIAVTASQAFVLTALQASDAFAGGMYLLACRRGVAGWQLTDSRRLAEGLEVNASIGTDGLRVATSVGFNTSAELFALTDGQLQADATLIVPSAPASDSFGRAVALSGDTLLAASGGGGQRGALPAVDVFEHRPGGWRHGQRLPPPTGLDLSEPLFGGTIAVDGERALVGAAQIGTGRVFVYARRGGIWELDGELAYAGPPVYTEFGRTLALSGDTALVGDPAADAARGMVHVYRHSAGQWIEEAVLLPSSTQPYQQFGRSLAIRGNLVVVGGDGLETFERLDGVWSGPIPLAAEQGGTLSGHHFALDGDTLLAALRESPTAVVLRRSAALTWGESSRFPAAGEPWRLSLRAGTALIAAAGEPPDVVRTYVYREHEAGWQLSGELRNPSGQPDRFPIAFAADGFFTVLGSPTTSGPFPFGNELEGEIRVYDQRVTFASGFE